MKLNYHHFVYRVLFIAGFLAQPALAMNRPTDWPGEYTEKNAICWEYNHKVKCDSGGTPSAESTGRSLYPWLKEEPITADKVESMRVDCVVVHNPRPNDPRKGKENENNYLQDVEHDTAELCQFINHRKPESVHLCYVNQDLTPLLEKCAEARIKELGLSGVKLNECEWEAVTKIKSLERLSVSASPGGCFEYFKHPEELPNLRFFDCNYKGGDSATQEFIRKLQKQAAENCKNPPKALQKEKNLPFYEAGVPCGFDFRETD